MKKMYMQQTKPKRIPAEEIISDHFKPKHADGGWIVFDDFDEEVIAYDECIKRVLANPRFYLDNLHNVKGFKVSWLNYSGRVKCKEINRNYAISHPFFPENSRKSESFIKA